MPSLGARPRWGALGLLLALGIACAARAQPVVTPSPSAKGAPQSMARVSTAVPEACVLIQPVAGRIRANGDRPSDENERRATDELAREAAKVGGQLVVPWGLGHSLNSVTRYGYAFRCPAQALAAMNGRLVCREGSLALPPTAQEQRWGTIPSSVNRFSDCTIRSVFRFGTKMPRLGVAEYFAYDSEDCAPSDGNDKRSEAACAQKLGATKRTRDNAQTEADGLLAHAVRVKEETLAASASEQAFRKLADAYGKDNAIVSEARNKYRTARLRCQRDDACNTFGDDPVPRGPVGAPRAVSEIEALRDDARYAEAALAAVNAAKAGARQDPGQTMALYAWHAARILFLDMGQVKAARQTLEGVLPTLQRLWQDDQRGVGASFGMAPFHVETAQLANTERTLALARLADGDRAGAVAAFDATCKYGGCAAASPNADYSLQKEQALLELGLGHCPVAAARLSELVRATASGTTRDARWLDASLDLLSAGIVCGKSERAEASFRTLISEDARLNGVNAGESGASAGVTLGRRLAYVLLSWALAKPDERVRRDLALDAVLSLKGNLLTLQREALRRAKPEDAQALSRQLDATYAPLARAGEEAVITLALHPGSGFQWRDNPWRLRKRADALERERARLAAIDGRAAIDAGSKVAASLGAGQPLLEYVRFRPYDFKPDTTARFGADHYAVFVVRRGEAPALFDLGPASTIDQLSDELLNSIQSCSTCPQRGITLGASVQPSSSNPAQALYRALLEPVAKLLGPARDLYIAADAALWRVPFAALEDNAGRVLLDEGYVFRYLPTSRELTRAPAPNPAKSFFALAAPDYGPLVPDRPFQSFKELPNTLTEANALAGLWKTSGPAKVPVDLRLGAQASKQTLLGVSSYGVLHIATHGWFLPSTLPRPLDSSLFLTPELADIAPPMVRTGLALSGANRGLDGTVTALELSTLDLRSTQLVVLSACETGRGEVSSGEGVFGLSRAFLSDGAETVVSSLWNVDDASTRTLMLAYYARLLRREDRVTSLYQAARELRATPAHHAPWFWAPFLVYGRGGPLRL